MVVVVAAAYWVHWPVLELYRMHCPPVVAAVPLVTIPFEQDCPAWSTMVAQVLFEVVLPVVQVEPFQM